MNKENIPVITDREKLYDKCENMEQLFDKYYLPLLDKHYSKTYKLQQENQSLKKQLEEYKEEKQEWINLLDMFKTQQKEFISYLENCINELKKESTNELQNTINLGIVDITKEILSKYQEITGQQDGQVSGQV